MMPTNYIPTVDEAERIAREANRMIREALGPDTDRATVTAGVVRAVLIATGRILDKPKEAKNAHE